MHRTDEPARRVTRWTARVAATALAACALTTAASVRAQGSAMDDEARRLYDEARKAKDKSDFATCTAKMRAAWALKKHRQVAGLLGECELKTGAHRDAAEHLAYFLDHAADASPEVVGAVKALYDQARAEIAVVTVKASAPDAERKVDGRQLGADETRVFLPPGEHSFAASKADGARVEKKIFVAAGQEREVVLELEAPKDATTPPPAVAPAAPSPASPPPEEKSGGPSVVPGLVVGGVGLVGVGLGVVFLAMGGSAGSEADALAEDVDADGGVCPSSGAFAERCAAFDDKAGDQATFTTVGAISLIGGGLLLAGGVGWTVWAATREDGAETARAPHITLAPSVGATPGIVAAGSF